MHSVHFHKLVPSGNPTLILTGELPQGISLAMLCATLIHPMHVGAEQAGYLLFPAETADKLPSLRMMGDEFCVNATRAAALLLAHANCLVPLCEGVLHGTIKVSGTQNPIYVLVAQDETTLLKAIAESTGAWETTFNGTLQSSDIRVAATGLTLAVAACMHLAAEDITISDIAEGATLVRLPGISHLLLDSTLHPLPESPRLRTPEWRKKANLTELPASGIIWYQQRAHKFYIDPLIFVKATGTEYHETACGSASLALALAHALHWNATIEGQPPRVFPPLEIGQPSGEHLTVSLTRNAAATPSTTAPALHAFVSGPVHLVAKGTANV